MKHSTGHTRFFINAVLACCSTATVAASQTPTVAIEHVNIIPMDRNFVLRDQTVVTRDGVILSIAPSDTAPIPTNARRIDGTDRYLIPGLTDAHVHVFDPNDLPLMLAHGITTVLNMSGSPAHLRWRDELRRGTRVGPQLFTTGPQLKNAAHPALDTEQAVLDAAAAETIIRAQVEAGYDFAKSWSSFSPDIFLAIMTSAKRHGLRVTGHIPREVGLAAALDSGMHSIAHIEEFFNKHFRRQIDPDGLDGAVDLTAQAGVPVITTLITYEAISRAASEDMSDLLQRDERALLDPIRAMSWEPAYNRYHQGSHLGRDQFYRDALDFKMAIAKALHEGGVMLLAGTDAGELPGLVPGIDLHRELELLVDAGLTPYEALETATRNPGRYLGGTKPFGTIAPGWAADLVLLDHNPLDDISSTRRIRGVMVRGRWHDRAALDRLLAENKQRNDATARFVELIITQGLANATNRYKEIKGQDADAFLFAETPLIFLAYINSQTGDMNTALGVLQLVILEYPERYRAYYMLGGALAAMGEVQQAKQMLNQVLTLEPGHFTAKSLLAQLGES